jgi:hypothetical protein
MRAHTLASLGILSAAAGLFSACGGGDSFPAISTAGGTSSSSSTSTSSSSSASSSSSSSSSGAGGMASTLYPAPHAPAPQVVQGPGQVLANPNFIPVFFAGDDASTESALEEFISKLGASAYWSTVTSEYGVGAATSGTPVILTETAAVTVDGSTIPAWIQSEIDSGALPMPDANTVYVLHYPAGTTITMTSQGQTVSSCAQNGFGGYHDTAPLTSGGQVAYAVIPRCTTLDGLSGIDVLTGAESHELVEASTDPVPTQTGAAFAEPDTADIFWELALGGGEVGDMCAQNPGAFVKDTELGFTVQRIWSNKSAAASHDPCVPLLTGEVYFNAAPDVTTTTSVDGIDMHAITIPVGQTKTVEVDLFSDAATSGPFTVAALDFASLAEGQPTNLMFSWNKTSGVNGDKLQLSISAEAAGEIGASLFIITSTLGTQTNLWVGLVTN